MGRIGVGLRAARPYVVCVKHLAVRPVACPIRGLRRIGRRRASDMGTDLIHVLSSWERMSTKRRFRSRLPVERGGEVRQLGNFLNRADHVGKLCRAMCFQALLIFGEKNPLADPITAPSLSRPSANSSKA
jgi:hypothetical protein